MRRLILRAAARRDLADIVSFIAEASGHVDAGERFADRLVAQCERLALLPGTLGRPRPELLPHPRSFVFGQYLIFFRDEPGVLVSNILTGSRDIDAFFAEGP